MVIRLKIALGKKNLSPLSPLSGRPPPWRRRRRRRRREAG